MMFFAASVTTKRTGRPSLWRSVVAKKKSNVKLSCNSLRCFSSEMEEPRESMPFDVLVVGGGPAGLAAAIRLKQQQIKNGGDELSVCVIDKGSEIGSHILSGNVLDATALRELMEYENDDTWRAELLETTGSYATPVSQDEFLVFPNATSAPYKVPNMLLPPQIHNQGNYIISLSNLCRWLGTKAEELGVEVYPGFAASDVIVQDGAVQGVVTRDVGVGKDGQPKPVFERGVELRARLTLLGEGARGSLTEKVTEEFSLREGVAPQTYGLGVKEVWQIPAEKLRPGLVQHTLGWPLQSGLFDKTFGGSFLYHQEPDLVLLGVVVGLDYANPYLSPYKEFQRWKTHPSIQEHLQDGTCISYGARVLNEGGFHSIPRLTFPGGALIGCSAGFLNAIKIKGTHTAIKSGMLAAEQAYEALTAPGQQLPVAETMEIDSDARPVEITSYTQAVKDSSIHEELYQVRNTHEAFARWGVGPGLVYTGLSTFITKGREPWTLEHTKPDSEATEEATSHKPIDYPTPDGKLTFDLLTNLQRSGVYHEDDQPSHLKIKPQQKNIPENVSLQQYAAPESRFCPAGVYEYVEKESDGESKKELVINAQNCVHCKCCSIKTKCEFIEWTVPEGGGGPQYQNM